jgi:ribonuclease J
LGAEGVLALLSDSTGAERAGFTPSEQLIDSAFDQIFRDAPGRIIIATFSSLLSRVQQAINAAQRHGRVVALAGYSMFKTAEIGRELGHLDIPPGILVDLYETRKLPENRVVIVTTGSQGQPEAALARMAEGSHRQIDIKPGDTVVVSSNPIPGNEEDVARVINKLFSRGANVIYPPLAPVHVSGHASQEELKLMLSLTRPRFFVPIHGELRHLHAHARLAGQLGIPVEDTFILENGSVLELSAEGAEILDHIPNQNVFVDGAGVGDIGPAVMRERESLARDGFVVAVVPVSLATGEVTGKPELISRGFVYLRESQDLMDKAAERAWSALRGVGNRKTSSIVDRTEEVLRLFFYDETRRKPTIIAVVTKV